MEWDQEQAEEEDEGSRVTQIVSVSRTQTILIIITGKQDGAFNSPHHADQSVLVGIVVFCHWFDLILTLFTT